MVSFLLARETEAICVAPGDQCGLGDRNASAARYTPYSTQIFFVKLHL
jgi:hypothetical protein